MEQLCGNGIEGLLVVEGSKDEVESGDKEVGVGLEESVGKELIRGLVVGVGVVEVDVVGKE